MRFNKKNKPVGIVEAALFTVIFSTATIAIAATAPAWIPYFAYKAATKNGNRNNSR